MQNILKNILLFFLCIGMLISCTQKIDSRNFLKWLNDSDNGLSISKKSNSFDLKLKYLPPQYFISRELILRPGSLNKNATDSIKNEYEKNLYFLLHIDNDNSVVPEQADVMLRDIHNYSEYTERIYKYNFNLNEDIELKRGNVIYHPVISTFENHYGLEGGRNLLLVFTPENDKDEFLEKNDLEIIFRDEELGIGTTHFVFEKKDLKNIPELIL